MIENNICPYCRRPLIKAENQDNSRSVEHLIPNAVLTRRRNKDEGDFYACRKCNSEKSKIDYVLGVIAKAQSSNDTLAADTLIKSIEKDNGATKRFIDMTHTARPTNEGTIHAEIPINAQELIEYMHYLGKGQYFKLNHNKLTYKLYNPREQVMLVEFVNKQALYPLEGSYTKRHKTNPFQDLQRNPYTEVINSGECLIWAKNNNFLFVFHNYTAVIVKVLKKNKKNIAKVKKSESYLYEHFNYVR